MLPLVQGPTPTLTPSAATCLDHVRQPRGV